MLAVRCAGAILPYWYLEQWNGIQKEKKEKNSEEMTFKNCTWVGTLDSLVTHWLLTISFRKCTWTLQPKLSPISYNLHRQSVFCYRSLCTAGFLSRLDHL